MGLRNEELEYLINLAEEEIFDGNLEKGQNLLMTGLADEPGYARLHYAMAWLFHEYKEHVDLAIRHYELVLHFDVAYRQAYFALVPLCWEKQDFEKLKQLLRLAEQQVIDNDFVFEQLGKVAEKEDQLKLASGHYRKALMHSISNDRTRSLKGDLRRCNYKRFTKWRKSILRSRKVS